MKALRPEAIEAIQWVLSVALVGVGAGLAAGFAWGLVAGGVMLFIDVARPNASGGK